jgi:hypothetical protein
VEKMFLEEHTAQ